MTATLPPRDRTPLAVLTGVLAATLYVATSQSSYWSDGRLLIERISTGAEHYHVSSYLHVGGLAARLGEALGADVETSLETLSALCTAIAVGAVAWAARTLALRRGAAVGGALLFALAPTMWFYATCVELHPPQVLVAGLAIATAAGWRARGQAPDALALGAWLFLLVWTHPSGALLTPAAALLAFLGPAGWRRPRRLVPAVLVALVAVPAWLLLASDAVSWGRIRTALLMTGRRWEPAFVYDELVVTTGVLAAVALLGPLLRPRRTDLALGAAVLLPFLLVVPGFGVAERGGYVASAFPWLGLAGAWCLERARGRWLVLALALTLPAQAWLGHRYLQAWEHEYPGVEWSREFVAETDGDGFLLALELWEMDAVVRHSHATATALYYVRRGEQRVIPADDPEIAALTLAVLEEVAREGSRLGVTRSLLEHAETDPAVRGLLDRIVERFGEPRPAARPEYLLFPPFEPAKRDE